MRNTKPNSRFWFWAWLVLVTMKRNGNGRKNPKCLVWKNLILVSGDDEVAAYQKAWGIGKESESKRQDSTTLDGQPALTKFLGIADMGFIHDPLSDGCELYFRETRAPLSTARRSVAEKKKLLASIRHELNPYLKLRWNPEVANKE